MDRAPGTGVLPLTLAQNIRRPGWCWCPRRGRAAGRRHPRQPPVRQGLHPGARPRREHVLLRLPALPARRPPSSTTAAPDRGGEDRHAGSSVTSRSIWPCGRAGIAASRGGGPARRARRRRPSMEAAQQGGGRHLGPEPEGPPGCPSSACSRARRRGRGGASAVRRGRAGAGGRIGPARGAGPSVASGRRARLSGRQEGAGLAGVLRRPGRCRGWARSGSCRRSDRAHQRASSPGRQERGAARLADRGSGASSSTGSGGEFEVRPPAGPFQAKADRSSPSRMAARLRVKARRPGRRARGGSGQAL